MFSSVASYVSSLIFSDAPSPPLAPPERTCVVCSEPQTLICPSCQSAPYCSRACQNTDEDTHSILCSSFGSLGTAPPLIEGSPDFYRRGLYFPADETTPRFIWVSCYTFGSHNPFEESRREDIIGEDLPMRTPIDTNPFRRRKLAGGAFFEIIHRSEWRVDGSAVNKSIEEVTNMPQNWRGPVLIMKRKGMDNDRHKYYVDMDMSDWRDVVEIFAVYHEGT